MKEKVLVVGGAAFAQAFTSCISHQGDGNSG